MKKNVMHDFRVLCIALCILTIGCEEPLQPVYPETTPERPALVFGWVALEGRIEILEESFSGPVNLTCPSGKGTTTATSGLYSLLIRVERTAAIEPVDIETCRLDVGDPVVVSREVVVGVTAQIFAVPAGTFDVIVVPEMPPVAQMQPPILHLDAGAVHTCAVGGDGRAHCWGRNVGGQLGIGNTLTVRYPSSANTTERFAQIGTAGTALFPTSSFAESGTCARREDDVVFCWGTPYGALLDPQLSFQQFKSPQRAITVPPIRRFIGGGSLICGITPGQDVYCWSNFGGSVVYSDVIEADRGRRTCVIFSDRRWSCTGTNEWGQKGDTTAAQRFHKIAAGLDFTCGLDAEGVASCWGRNNLGQLGRGAFDIECQNEFGQPAPCPGQTINSLPQPVQSNLRFTAIAAGLAHVCALATDGRVFCWGGDESQGKLGVGTISTPGSAVPLQVASTERFRMISAGERHTCAVTTNERVMCWGSNAFGQLGDGTTSDRSTPQSVLMP